MASVLESPYWLGWAAPSWGTSWGYDGGGEPILVEEFYKGVSSADGDDEDPIVEHAKARGEAGRKQYAPTPVALPEPASEEPVHEIPPTAPVLVEPHAPPQPALPTIDTTREVAAVIDAAVEQALLKRRQREEEMMLLAMLDV